MKSLVKNETNASFPFWFEKQHTVAPLSTYHS